MTLVLIALVVGVLGGGYGGYKVGRSIEKKAQAAFAVLKSAAEALKNSVK